MDTGRSIAFGRGRLSVTFCKSVETFDYIIIGAGTAGCVVADRLSADGPARVLLLEAGGSDRRASIRVPIGYGRTFHDPIVNWRYHAEPDPGICHRSSYWPRGKVLGGSSSINGLVYCRGIPADYDDWRDAGNPGWGWDDVEPMYRSFERHVADDGAIKGDGPLWVSHSERHYHPLKQHFYAAARELRLPIANLTGPKPEGVGPYAINTRAGLRCSSADAFLRPAMRRRNLTVRTHCFVERIAFEGRRATGVVCRSGAERHLVACSREVIVSAGAVNSPKLLQLSGIGPADLLTAHGIEMVHANSAVGAGLQDHLGINYFYRSMEPTLNALLGSWPGRIRSGLQFLLTRTGPFTLSVNQIGGLVRSSPIKIRPDVQLYFNPLSYSVEYVDKRPLLKPDRFPGFIMGFNACRPTSRGRIDIVSADPAPAPRIVPNYLSTNQDVADVIAGARLIGRLHDTAAMRRLIDGRPQLDLIRLEGETIVEDFRARCGTVFHPCGTCRMAPESTGGVVGHDLRVHGVDRLRVVDASVFPNITSANINAPTFLVAHMAARAILRA